MLFYMMKTWNIKNNKPHSLNVFTTSVSTYWIWKERFSITNMHRPLILCSSFKSSLPMNKKLQTEHSLFQFIQKHPLDTVDYKPAKWLRYVNNTFVVWPHGPAKLFFIILTVLGLPTNSQWKLKLMIPFHSWMFWLWSGVQNWPWKCNGSLLILVVICNSSPTTHITWKGETFIVWSIKPRTYVRIRRISMTQLRKLDMIWC